MVMMLIRILVVAVVGVIAYHYIWEQEYALPSEKTLAERANMKVYPIGNYDEKLLNSVRYWSYEFFVMAYLKGVYEEVKTAAYKWQRNQDDPDSYILAGLDMAIKQIDSEIDAAKFKEDQKPVFKRFAGYDYHVVAKSMLYNDHIDCSEMAIELDRIFGGRYD